MQVELAKGALVVKVVPFNPAVVAILGTLEGRTFDTVTKDWKIPVAQVENVVNVLRDFGFSFSPAVIEAFGARVILKKKIERIKGGLFRPNEIALLKEINLPFYLYQEIGAGFMAVAESSLLGDQPGLGKTLQTIGSTKITHSNKNLIFCPMSVKKTWQEELEKWYPGATSIIVGGTPKQRAEQWGTDVNYYICNYHLLQRDLKVMKSVKWDHGVADEATCISNPKSQTAKNLKKLKFKYKNALTGTPLSNSVEDIWSIMDWVQPGLLGTYWQFIEEYCIRDRFNAITGYKNLSKLKEKIGPFMLRRLKKDVLIELPPKTFENIYVEFSDTERKLYNQIKEELTEELQAAGMFDNSNLQSALVKIVRLTQMADSSELINGTQESSKLEALKETLKIALANDEKAIIFTSYREMALILMRELEMYKPLLIAGGVSPEERDANRKMFNEDDEHKILIMTSAGSMGLNLQRATSVFHYDIPWSISQAEQREDRAHRNGQLGNVTIYRMMVRDTVDEYKLKVLYKKQVTSEAVLGDNDVDEAKKIKLTKSDLRNILS